MLKTVIIGLNSNLLNFIDNLSGEIIVIDEVGLKSKGQYIGFESEKVLALYQASLIAGQVEHSDFESSSNFYEHIFNQQHELEYMNHKQLIDILESKNVKILKGRFKLINPHSAELSYLGETKEITFSTLINNTNLMEENHSDSPFIFTFDQFLQTGQLFEKILVKGKTLRSLEIASMMARFGSEVVLVLPARLLNQIEHLLFRDEVRDILSRQNIKVLEKYEIESIEDLDSSAIVHVNPLSKLAFEVTEPVSNQSFEVQAIIVESDVNKSTFDASELDYSAPINKTESLFINPVLSVVKSNQETQKVQFDAQEFTYFQTRFEIEGGIEFLVNQDHIVGGTFFCFNALELSQLLKLMELQPLEELKQMDVFENSLLGVFKEAARKILENRGNYAREEISSFN